MLETSIFAELQSSSEVPVMKGALIVVARVPCSTATPEVIQRYQDKITGWTKASAEKQQSSQI
jgi:hypothetical protein